MSDGKVTSLSPIGQPRFEAAAVASGGRILVFGGVAARVGTVLSSSERYDPGTDMQVASHMEILVHFYLSLLAL